MKFHRDLFLKIFLIKLMLFALGCKTADLLRPKQVFADDFVLLKNLKEKQLEDIKKMMISSNLLPAQLQNEQYEQDAKVMSLWKQILLYFVQQLKQVKNSTYDDEWLKKLKGVSDEKLNALLDKFEFLERLKLIFEKVFAKLKEKNAIVLDLIDSTIEKLELSKEGAILNFKTDGKLSEAMKQELKFLASTYYMEFDSMFTNSVVNLSTTEVKPFEEVFYSNFKDSKEVINFHALCNRVDKCKRSLLAKCGDLIGAANSADFMSFMKNRSRTLEQNWYAGLFFKNYAAVLENIDWVKLNGRRWVKWNSIGARELNCLVFKFITVLTDYFKTIKAKKVSKKVKMTDKLMRYYEVFEPLIVSFCNVVESLFSPVNDVLRDKKSLLTEKFKYYLCALSPAQQQATTVAELAFKSMTHVLKSVHDTYPLITGPDPDLGGVPDLGDGDPGGVPGAVPGGAPGGGPPVGIPPMVPVGPHGGGPHGPIPAGLPGGGLPGGVPGGVPGIGPHGPIPAGPPAGAPAHVDPFYVYGLDADSISSQRLLGNFDVPYVEISKQWSPVHNVVAPPDDKKIKGYGPEGGAFYKDLAVPPVVPPVPPIPGAPVPVAPDEPDGMAFANNAIDSAVLTQVAAKHDASVTDFFNDGVHGHDKIYQTNKLKELFNIQNVFDTFVKACHSFYSNKSRINELKTIANVNELNKKIKKAIKDVLAEENGKTAFGPGDDNYESECNAFLEFTNDLTIDEVGGKGWQDVPILNWRSHSAKKGTASVRLSPDHFVKMVQAKKGDKFCFSPKNTSAKYMRFIKYYKKASTALKTLGIISTSLKSLVRTYLGVYYYLLAVLSQRGNGDLKIDEETLRKARGTQPIMSNFGNTKLSAWKREGFDRKVNNKWLSAQGAWFQFIKACSLFYRKLNLKDVPVGKSKFGDLKKTFGRNEETAEKRALACLINDYVKKLYKEKTGETLPDNSFTTEGFAIFENKVVAYDMTKPDGEQGVRWADADVDWLTENMYRASQRYGHSPALIDYAFVNMINNVEVKNFQPSGKLNSKYEFMEQIYADKDIKRKVDNNLVMSVEDVVCNYIIAYKNLLYELVPKEYAFFLDAVDQDKIKKLLETKKKKAVKPSSIKKDVLIAADKNTDLFDYLTDNRLNVDEVVDQLMGISEDGRYNRDGAYIDFVKACRALYDYVKTKKKVHSISLVNPADVKNLIKSVGLGKFNTDDTRFEAECEALVDIDLDGLKTYDKKGVEQKLSWLDVPQGKWRSTGYLPDSFDKKSTVKYNLIEQYFPNIIKCTKFKSFKPKPDLIDDKYNEYFKMYDTYLEFLREGKFVPKSDEEAVGVYLGAYYNLIDVISKVGDMARARKVVDVTKLKGLDGNQTLKDVTDATTHDKIIGELALTKLLGYKKAWYNFLNSCKNLHDYYTDTYDMTEKRAQFLVGNFSAVNNWVKDFIKGDDAGGPDSDKEGKCIFKEIKGGNLTADESALIEAASEAFFDCEGLVTSKRDFSAIQNKGLADAIKYSAVFKSWPDIGLDGKNVFYDKSYWSTSNKKKKKGQPVFLKTIDKYVDIFKDYFLPRIKDLKVKLFKPNVGAGVTLEQLLEPVFKRYAEIPLDKTNVEFLFCQYMINYYKLIYAMFPKKATVVPGGVGGAGGAGAGDAGGAGAHHVEDEVGEVVDLAGDQPFMNLDEIVKLIDQGAKNDSPYEAKLLHFLGGVDAQQNQFLKQLLQPGEALDCYIKACKAFNDNATLDGFKDNLCVGAAKKDPAELMKAIQKAIKDFGAEAFDGFDGETKDFTVEADAFFDYDASAGGELQQTGAPARTTWQDLPLNTFEGPGKVHLAGKVDDKFSLKDDYFVNKVKNMLLTKFLPKGFVEQKFLKFFKTFSEAEATLKDGSYKPTDMKAAVNVYLGAYYNLLVTLLYKDRIYTPLKVDYEKLKHAAGNTSLLAFLGDGGEAKIKKMIESPDGAWRQFLKASSMFSYNSDSDHYKPVFSPGGHDVDRATPEFKTGMADLIAKDASMADASSKDFSVESKFPVEYGVFGSKVGALPITPTNWEDLISGGDDTVWREEYNKLNEAGTALTGGKWTLEGYFLDKIKNVQMKSFKPVDFDLDQEVDLDQKYKEFVGLFEDKNNRTEYLNAHKIDGYFSDNLAAYFATYYNLLLSIAPQKAKPLNRLRLPEVYWDSQGHTDNRQAYDLKRFVTNYNYNQYKDDSPTLQSFFGGSFADLNIQNTMKSILKKGDALNQFVRVCFYFYKQVLSELTAYRANHHAPCKFLTALGISAAATDASLVAIEMTVLDAAAQAASKRQFLAKQIATAIKTKLAGLAGIGADFAVEASAIEQVIDNLDMDAINFLDNIHVNCKPFEDLSLSAFRLVGKTDADMRDSIEEYKLAADKIRNNTYNNLGDEPKVLSVYLGAYYNVFKAISSIEIDGTELNAIADDSVVPVDVDMFDEGEVWRNFVEASRLIWVYYMSKSKLEDLDPALLKYNISQDALDLVKTKDPTADFDVESKAFVEADVLGYEEVDGVRKPVNWLFSKWDTEYLKNNAGADKIKPAEFLKDKLGGLKYKSFKPKGNVNKKYVEFFKKYGAASAKIASGSFDMKDLVCNYMVAYYNLLFYLSPKKVANRQEVMPPAAPMPGPVAPVPGLGVPVPGVPMPPAAPGPGLVDPLLAKIKKETELAQSIKNSPKGYMKTPFFDDRRSFSEFESAIASYDDAGLGELYYTNSIFTPAAFSKRVLNKKLFDSSYGWWLQIEKAAVNAFLQKYEPDYLHEIEENTFYSALLEFFAQLPKKIFDESKLGSILTLISAARPLKFKDGTVIVDPKRLLYYLLLKYKTIDNAFFDAAELENNFEELPSFEDVNSAKTLFSTNQGVVFAKDSFYERNKQSKQQYSQVNRYSVQWHELHKRVVCAWCMFYMYCISGVWPSIEVTRTLSELDSANYLKYAVPILNLSRNFGIEAAFRAQGREFSWADFECFIDGLDYKGYLRGIIAQMMMDYDEEDIIKLIKEEAFDNLVYGLGGQFPPTTQPDDYF